MSDVCLLIICLNIDYLSSICVLLYFLNVFIPPSKSNAAICMHLNQIHKVQVLVKVDLFWIVSS